MSEFTTTLLFAGAGRDLEEARRAVEVSLGGGRRLFVVACASPTSGVPKRWVAGSETAGVFLLDDLSPGDADADEEDAFEACRR